MVDTIKFSQMTSGGDLANNDLTPGLQSGENVLFNNPWTFLPPGTTAQRPTPSAAINFRLRFNTEDQLYEYYDAVAGNWTQLQESAFTVGPFITYTASASLPDAQNLGLLANGILKQSITAGVATLDIAVNGTDYYGPGFVVRSADGGTGVNNGSLTITLGGGVLNYVLTSDSSGNATWQPLSSSGAITTIDGDSGAATPTAGVVTLTGASTGLTFTGSGSTLTLGGVLSPVNGGTGVNNGASTLTLAGSLSTIGAFTAAFTFIGNTGVTFPTSGTLATTSQIPSFPLSPTNGGTGVSDPTAHGIMVAEGSSPMTPIVLGAGQVLIGTTSGDPVAAAIGSGTGILVGNASGAITVSLAPIATLTGLVNTTGGSAAPVATTLSAWMDAALGSTRGDILYRNATVWTVLAPGTAGFSLQTGGAGADPSYSNTFTNSTLVTPATLGVQQQALNMNSHLINNVTDPVSAQDAMTLHYAGLTYLALAGGTMTGDISMGSAHRVTNALDPNNPQDYATKNYVDQNALNGTSVYAATTGSLGTVTQSGAGVGATLTNAGAQATLTMDGATPPVGQNVLIKNNATGMTSANQGIYTVTNAGSNSTNWVLTRATSYDTPAEINDTGLILIQNGGQAGQAWYNAATIVTVDTTAFNFNQFGNVSPGVTNPNVVIGGNFDTNPWQRGVSFALSTGQGYTADRFFWANNGGVGGVTITQTADAPTEAQAGILVNNCLKIAVTTLDASIGASDLYSLFYKYEGYDWAQIAQRSFTLSFWVKATVTGIYTVGFNNAVDRSYIAEYTVNTTLTWELKTITVPASPSGGTWNYTNGEGLRMCFNLATGSTWNTAAGSWTTGGPFFGSSNQVNAMSSTSNIFEMVLVKVEPGTNATPYPVELEADVLSRCQRYYESGMTVNKYFSAATSGYSNESENSLACFNGNGGATVYYRTTKRANPTFSIKAHDGTAGQVLLQTVGNVTPSAINAGTNIATLTVGGATNGINFYWQADADL
jgi:hypothetical protein